MRAIFLGLVGVLLGGCSEVVRGGTRDGGADDAGDAPREAGRDAPRPPVDLCSAPGIIDLNATGLAFGRGLTAYVDADRLERAALPPSLRCPPAEPTAARRVILRYTPPVDAYVDVLIRAVGATPLTAEATYAALRDGCAADARELACTQQFGLVALNPRARLAAGRPVYLVAALGTGPWAVEIRASPEAEAPGAPCEDARGCVAGHTCVSGRCAADGGLRAFCRAAGAPCDEGLTCIELRAGAGWDRCLRPFRLGERCDPSVGACVEGVCGGAAESRCVLPGARSAPCRVAGAPCDAGLTCAQGGWCVEARAAGAWCSSEALARPCAPGESCVAVEGGARCVRDGVLGGACGVAASGARCEAGLQCAAGASPGLRCATVQGEGRACSPTRPSDCDPTTECVPSIEGDGRCVRRGREGTFCSSASVGDCDPGLACSQPAPGASTRCAAPLRAGAGCGNSQWACEAGTSCAQVPLALLSPRCVRDGEAFGWCRATGAPCDDGLGCTPEHRCLPRVGDGEACDPARQACGPGFRCNQTCRRDGAPGGFCRLSAPACDAGSVCRDSDGFFPACVRVISVGEPCGASMSPGQCAEGSECVGGPAPSARCARRGALFTRCDRAAPRCDEGLTCSPNSTCLPTLRLDDPCSDPWSGACGAGLTCGSSVPRVPPRCLADGALGARCRAAGEPCEAGLACVEAAGAERWCVRRSPAGAACDGNLQRCAADVTCVDGVCAADGAAGRRCRASDRPCDDGLRCVLGACLPTVTGECAPRSNACVAPSECTWSGSAYACAPGAYAVEVTRGAAFEDPCLLDGAPLTSPLRFRLFGGEFEVTTARDGVPRLVDARGSLALLPHGVATPPSVFGCSVVVGAAPTRRFMIGGGAWATHIASGVQRPSNAVAILHEGSNVIEYRYTRPVPQPSIDALPAWATPAVQWTSGGAVFRVTAPWLELTEGLSVRFTPR